MHMHAISSLGFPCPRRQTDANQSGSKNKLMLHKCPTQLR
jgi:hypothetical protein